MINAKSIEAVTHTHTHTDDLMNNKDEKTWRHRAFM